MPHEKSVSYIFASVQVRREYEQGVLQLPAPVTVVLLPPIYSYADNYSKRGRMKDIVGYFNPFLPVYLQRQDLLAAMIGLALVKSVI